MNFDQARRAQRRRPRPAALVVRAAALAAKRAGALLCRSTKRRRRRDITAHYDLDNELFARMLDPTMSYSCALFEREGMTLEQAQVAKLERVCEQLYLGPGDRVLQIGTGWGAFALHAAATNRALGAGARARARHPPSRLVAKRPRTQRGDALPAS
jgi:Mycolic acid cyclopropane synthetase